MVSFNPDLDPLLELVSLAENAQPGELQLVQQVLRQATNSNLTSQAQNIWTMLKQGSEINLNTVAILAVIDPDSANWRSHTYAIANTITKTEFNVRMKWIELLGGISTQLETPLLEIGQSNLPSVQDQREAANDILLRWMRDKPKQLARLIIHADEKTFKEIRRMPEIDQSDIHDQINSVASESEYGIHRYRKSESQSYKPLTSSAHELLKNSHGFANDDFAICLQVDDKNMHNLLSAMQPAGYRPSAIHFDTTGKANLVNCF